jgi:glycerate 2-kinase
MIASRAVVTFASQQLGLQHPPFDIQVSDLRNAYDYSKYDFEQSVLLDRSVSCRLLKTSAKNNRKKQDMKEKLSTTGTVLWLIANRRELAKFHNGRPAKLILAALEAAIDSVGPDALVRQAVKLDGKLSVRDIHGNTAKFQKFDNVYVVGAGKAAGGMAGALYSILKNRISAGAITVPHGTRIKSRAIEVTEASHPVPDRSGVEGTKKIIDVLGKAGQGDLVFVLISGGGSALMPMPAPGVSLHDKQRITNLLLGSGASIQEVNVVRRHLSSVKGGQLLRHVDRSCTVVSLILSDVVGDDVAAIASGPTCPDNSTFKDAQKILKKYRVKSPGAVDRHISKGVKGEIDDTPKPGDPVFSRVHNMVIGNNALACKGAVDYLIQHGLHAVHLGSEFDGEARDFGRFLARLSSDLAGAPFAIVAGGETTVRLNKSRNGTGGRNQEAALACTIELGQDVTVAFMGTDGIDGNSDAAGAMVSSKATFHAKKTDLQKYLDRHDSYHALKKMHSLIFTGYTGTNVNDIAIAASVKSG